MKGYRIIGFGLFWASLGVAQTIVTVQNAASLGGGIPSGGIAPGSMFTVQVLRGGPVVITPDLSKVSIVVKPRAGGGEIQAVLLRGSIGSYLATIPRNTPLGEADVLLTVDGQQSLPTPVQVVRTAPGLFARGRSGLGPAIVQNVGLGKPVQLNQFTNPARPGDYLTLWGTGLGASGTGDVTVEIAGVPVPASYAGPSSIPALDQINVLVPAGTPDSCFVSVLVRAGDGISNETTFAHGAGEGPCRDPFGFTPAELRALDEDQYVRLGIVSLRNEVVAEPGPPTQPVYSRYEALFGEFAKRDVEDVAMLAQPVVTDDRYFSCKLQNPFAVPRFTLSEPFDLGENLRVEGQGKSLDAPHPGVPILYLGILPRKAVEETSFYTAGRWTVRATGGRTVGAFTVSRDLPPVLRWNRGGITEVDRTRDLTVRWEGDGYTTEDVMTVTLTSASSTQARATAVACRAAASAGQVTIPAAMMADLARVPLGGQLQLRLAPRPDRRGRFELPLAGGGVERAVHEYLFTDTLRVTIR